MRLAATVMLARDSAAGIEFLMVRRSSQSPFAPDALVFPGGTVDAGDFVQDPPACMLRLQKTFRATVSPLLPCDETPITGDEAIALVNAAVREAREEASVEVSGNALHLFSHWITPPTEPRRYNTFFFVARARDGTHGSADEFETHDARWTTARAAFLAHAAAEVHLVYPTIKHLERALAFRTVEELIAFTKEKPIVTIMPWGAPSEGFTMPRELEGAW